MKAFELVSLRMGTAEYASSLTRIWITVTLAVFGAAYYAGPNLDGFSIGILIVVYAVVVAIVSLLLKQAMDRMIALSEDAADFRQTEDAYPHVLAHSLMLWPPLLSNTLLVIIPTIYLAYVIYLLKAAAIIGF
jgi:hypothetical protein